MAFWGLKDFFFIIINSITSIWEYITISIPLTVLVLGIPIVGFCFGLLKRFISM